MPILKNAKKALRASKKRETSNRRIKSKVKTNFDKLKNTPTKEILASTYSSIDKAAKKNIFHKNKAKRLKKQAANFLNKSK